MSTQSNARHMIRRAFACKRASSLWLLLKREQVHRCTSSTAFIGDFSISESVRETVKSSLLEQATRQDSPLWSANHHRHHNPPSGEQQQHAINGQHHDDSGLNGVDHPISTQVDPLEEWHVDEPTRHWPHLPPGVKSLQDTNYHADPFVLAKADLDSLSHSIRRDLLGTEHPVLHKAASYFFQDLPEGGKKVRPMMVLLLSRALANSAEANDNHSDNNTSTLLSPPMSWQRPDLPQAQRRLAEISEMIHTASLFHDDVIDGAETRRAMPAVHMVFGNKMAILAGDYLLARASIYLARLRNVEVVEAMSTIIEHLVRGEVMQMRGTRNKQDESSKQRLLYSLQKNYYKTASLMANSCKSAALLGDYPPEWTWASYLYGKHVGTAFQLMDDVLDLEGDASAMGKPAFADLKAGLSTAPVLLAAQEYPHDLQPLMDRKFRHQGDVERAAEIIFASRGLERTKELARVHAELAAEAVLKLHPSLHRDALVHLAYQVVNRNK